MRKSDVKEPNKNEDRFESSGTSPPLGSADATYTPPEKKKNYILEGFRNRTKGEGLFNTFTYTVVGYFGVTAFSVFMTWLLRDSNTILRTKFEGLVQGVTNYFTRNHTDPEKIAAITSKVNSNMNIAALFTGGTIVSVLPIKWLEDNKSPIVQKIDEKLYGKEAVENDPTLIKAHNEMEEVPKQSWGSVLASRLTAFGATYASSFAFGDASSWLGKKKGVSIDRMAVSVGRHLDSSLLTKGGTLPAAFKLRAQASPNSLLRSDTSANGVTATADTMRSRIFSYMAMDAAYTFITSKALFVFTRVFAPLIGKDRQSQPASASAHPLEPEQPPIIKEGAHPITSRAANENDKDGQPVIGVAANSNTPETTVSHAAGHQRLGAAHQGTPNLA